MKYILYNTEEKKTIVVDKKQLLYLINRDRSGEWSEYNMKDFGEGLREFTEFKFMGVEEE